MAQENPDALELIVQANDKLLKAFIALMAFKDEHLLSELRIVFAAVAVSQGASGEADDPALALIRRDLSQIAEIVERMAQAQSGVSSAQDTH